MAQPSKISFKKAVQIAKERGIKREYVNEADSVILSLKDGSRLEFISNYYDNGSAWTPEQGVEPPECFLYERS